MTSPIDPIRNAALADQIIQCAEAAYRDAHKQGGNPAAAMKAEMRAGIIRALSAGEPVAWQSDRLLALLRQHHDWHLQSGPIGLPDGDGGWIEINNALEYSDSRMCEETQAALEGQPAPELEPMPRGGINTWWWQIAVLQRREIRALKAQITAAPQPVAKPTGNQIEAAAKVIWDDNHARRGGSWESRAPDEVVVIQTYATARAALIAANAASPSFETNDGGGNG